MGLERFVHHVFDDGARGVEGTRLLAGGVLGFLVVGSEQVFKDLAQQFRIKGNFLIHRRVFDDGEFIGVQDVKKAANLLLLVLGVAVCTRKVFLVLAAEEEVVGDGWALFALREKPSR